MTVKTNLRGGPTLKKQALAIVKNATHQLGIYSVETEREYGRKGNP